MASAYSLSRCPRSKQPLCRTEASKPGRLAGDEFVALVEPGSFEIAPELVAERILEQCDLGQGYLFARPLNVDAVEKFLNAEKSTAPFLTSG